MKAFIICAVRGATEEQRNQIEQYVAALESNGYSVHYPARDTAQTGNGVGICIDNRNAIESCDEVHIFYDPNSAGTLFDLGMAFALGKALVVVGELSGTETKSFQNVILGWEDARRTD